MYNKNRDCPKITWVIGAITLVLMLLKVTGILRLPWLWILFPMWGVFTITVLTQFVKELKK